ncbi:MAG: GNAT family N-acetyltransferase [Chloroflexaceae bacterium]
MREKAQTELLGIRRAEPGEAAMLTDVAFAAKRHWGYPESWIQRWHHDLTITSVQIATYPVYVAVIADAIVGVSILSVDGSGFELEHFWVRPDYIGQGIGRQLFAHSREFIAARCGTHLRIEADPNAVGFYQRMGAVPIGEIAVWPERELPVLRLDINIHEWRRADDSGL